MIQDEEPSFTRTVAEVLVAYEPGDDESLTQAFEIALGAVRQIQRAYYLTTKEPLTLVSRESLPPVLPVGLREVGDAGDEWRVEQCSFAVNTNVGWLTREPDLDESELSNFNDALEILGSAPFAPAAELMGEARSVLLLRGDYRTAIIGLHACGEVMLEELLYHLLWEENRRPDEVASEFFEKQGFRTRLRRHYHTRLGGNWSIDGNGPVARWAGDLAAVRHRVVHAAYFPSSDEAYRAYDVARDFEEFIIDRVGQGAFLARYPRTGLALMGAQLVRLGRVTARMKRLMADPSEPQWSSTYERWKWVVNDCRDEEFLRFAASDETVSVLLWRHDAPPQWYLHDRTRRRVRPCTPPPDLTPDAWERMTAGSEQFLAQTSPGERVTAFWPGEPGTALEGTEWSREHEVLPLYGVMLDRSDFR